MTKPDTTAKVVCFPPVNQTIKMPSVKPPKGSSDDWQPYEMRDKPPGYSVDPKIVWLRRVTEENHESER